LEQDEFWNLVERVRKRFEADPPNVLARFQCERYADLLARELQDMSPLELASFQDHVQRAIAEAYTSGVYAASYLVLGGGSWDGFYDFRAWLVSQGREDHRKAVAEPDSLAEVCVSPVLDYECNAIRGVAKDLYAARTGQVMKWRSDPGDLDQPLPGEPWEVEDLPKLLPRLARIHFTPD
jgi:hypothetical protein